MASYNDNETGFSESDIHFARKTFYRDCPNGYCSKQKFLTFIRKSSSLHTQKCPPSNIFLQTIITRQNHRQRRKFFSMMFDIYDQNHDGQLDFQEYIYALSALTGANRLRTIETLYNFFDIKNQGYITRQEFNSRKRLAEQFLGQCKTGTNETNLSYEQAFNSMDKDKDERISKDEFIQWHLNDHLTTETDEIKPVRKRTRLLRNLSTLVDIRGQIKTSSLQQQQQQQQQDNNNNNNKTPIDAWLETTMNVNKKFNISPVSPPVTTTSINADRYLLKIFRRARNRFIQNRHSSNGDMARIVIDDQSDSGVFTSSSITNFNDDLESNSLLDIDEDEDYLQAIDTDDPNNELICQSLEAVLMETLIQLRQHRQQRSNTSNINKSNADKEQIIITRL